MLTYYIFFADSDADDIETEDGLLNKTPVESILLELSRDEEDESVVESHQILSSTSIVREAVLLQQVSPPSDRVHISKERTPSPVEIKERTP